ncbi:MAG TPA: hypothetical protein VED63_06445, partial [Acidimicrobiales bacterium]|nr:hypothetical protein [Acidimicrobiales bacterium]
YPYLHLACGLPLLVDAVDGLTAGGGASSVRVGAGGDEAGRSCPGADDAGQSTLRWHPTAWGYGWRWVRRGVR